MRWLPPRMIFTRYAVAWTYLGLFILTSVTYHALPGTGQKAMISWASTSVHNLERHPAGSLIGSAFIAQEAAAAWPVLIALAMFGANRALGNLRTFIVCAAGQVIGTLVSEGIAGYRLAHGQLPAADRYLTDVGPSYVVVAAIVIALLLGSWPARVAAAIDLILLIVAGNIFGGLSTLQVSAVGHVTAMAVAGAGLLLRRQAAQPRPAA